MHRLTVILNRQSIDIGVNNDQYVIPPRQLVICDERATIVCSNSIVCHQFDYLPGELYTLYCDLYDLLDKRPLGFFYRRAVQALAIEEDLFQVMVLLATIDPMVLLRFIYTYGLGHDRHYFSALLRFTISSDQHFFEFMKNNYLNAWPVARFAKELGMPLRKFNHSFQEKFGTTAKQWLLTRRLEHARKLVLSTSMRIVDIALECGFSNHAHFTDSFRKRYRQSPTEIREDR